ncbi:MAG: hypothetical protein ACKVVT_18010, partial [Dehalococcoidia bacterium]
GGTSSGLTLTISSTPPPPPPPPPPGSALYLSLASSTTVGGVSVANEDIFQRSATGTVSILFDGSDVGLSSARLDAFQVLSATQVLISLSSSATLTGLGTVDDSDILLFTGTLGSSTSGTLTMFFDGSGSGLTTSSEDVDGIYWDAATSKLYLSTSGSFTVTGLSGGRSDIFSCNGFAAGGACSSFSLYFDGDDIGLSGTSSENIDAFTIAPDGTIYFSLGGAFDLNGALAGAAGDVVACGAPTLGGSSACGSLTIVLAASSVGGGNVTGVDIP